MEIEAKIKEKCAEDYKLPLADIEITPLEKVGDFQVTAKGKPLCKYFRYYLADSAKDWDFLVVREVPLPDSVNDEAQELPRTQAYEPMRSRPYKPDIIRVERGDYTRASHLVVCTICSCTYGDHPPVLGYEWLTRLCDGRLVHL